MISMKQPVIFLSGCVGLALILVGCSGPAPAPTLAPPTTTPEQSNTLEPAIVGQILEWTETPTSVQSTSTSSPAPTKPTTAPARTQTPGPTKTPAPTNTPTQTPVSIPIDLLTPIVTATPLFGPEILLQTPVPDFLKGKILFFSDGYKRTTPFVMNSDGQLVSALTGMDYYRLAAARESYSPDCTSRTFFAADTNKVLQVWIEDIAYGTRQLVSHNAKKKAVDPVWSPDGTRIAYVSEETGADEIYVYTIADNTIQRVTFTNALYTYYLHPSWSPDSSQLLFQSNRDVGHYQIWIMGADGSNPHILHSSPYNDTAPVWVK